MENTTLQSPVRKAGPTVLRNMMVACLIAGCLTPDTKAQTVSQYSFSQVTTAYSTISTGGSNLSGNNWDNEVNTATLGFTFNFLGVNYTAVSVNSNGFLTFGGTLSSDTEYLPISSATAYSGAVSAMGRDLGGSPGNGNRIKSQTLGSAPNRVFVVEWTNAHRNNASGNAQSDNINFQIRLSETSNVINVVYSASTAQSTSLTVQVGLRGGSNSDFNNRSATGSWASTTAGGVNSASCTTTNTLLPAANLNFRWTPPPPACATVPTAPAVGATLCQGVQNLSWPSVLWATGYDVYLNTGATATTLVSSNQAATTYTTSSLSAGSYAWRIVPRNSTGTASGCANWLFTLNSNPSSANAGSAQTVCQTPGTATMNATAPSVGAGAWSFISGPSTPGITTPGSVSSGITGLTTAGAYTFRWTVSNSPCVASTSDVVITVNQNPSSANAGSAQSICSTSSATLAANSPSIGTGSWSIVAGSPNTSTAQLSSLSATNAVFTPSASGTYTLSWTIANSPCVSSTSNVVITVVAATNWYIDSDGDSFGNPSVSVLACTQPVGYVANNSDCDDSQNLYADGDGDGFGAGAPVACGVANNADCNDAQLQYADADGDGFGAGAPVACGVANNADCNDAQLQYADTDGDGFGAGAPVACGVANNSDNCPTVPGVQGSNCDAQPGPGFTLGQLNGSCVCQAIACTQNVVLELRTDANSQQAGWEILDQNSNLVICSGGTADVAFPSGITNPITQNCCLPVGCFRLRVSDSGGDGFVTGGYQLRESGMNGRRIIDNFGNFTTGGVSAIANTYDNGAFCVPVGSDKPIFSSCDKLDWVNYKFIVAQANGAVSAEFGSSNTTSGYEFWFFDPNGGYSYRRFRSHATSDGYGAGATRACHFKINRYSELFPDEIPQNVLLNVRIRGRVNGNNLPFGPACRFKIDPSQAACPIVKLQDNPALPEDYSCGVTRNWGGTNSAANRIIAMPPQFQPAPLAGGTGVRYQFRFRIPGEGVCIVRPPQPSPTLHLNWNTGTPLQCSKTYEVDVRVSKDLGASWCVGAPNPACDPNPVIQWGKICSVTTSSCLVGGGSSSLAIQNTGNLALYPNPNRGDQLFLNLTSVDAGVNTVSVDIYDLSGKRATSRTIAVQDGFVNGALDLNGDLSAGMYMVNITAGDKTYTERLVIQP